MIEILTTIREEHDIVEVVRERNPDNISSEIEEMVGMYLNFVYNVAMSQLTKISDGQYRSIKKGAFNG